MPLRLHHQHCYQQHRQSSRQEEQEQEKRQEQGAAGPLAPSTLSEHHQLDTNSYYRYSSRDNDPSVLLSRYPSLRLPPPPPEFADDFNEAIL
ncbi:hypothetical protein TYRP_012497 [Tyrophagus putrescentiae]|nr:hypothetical protein TYRP_012497 [Tyrophagus putrescentiae]